MQVTWHIRASKGWRKHMRRETAKQRKFGPPVRLIPIVTVKGDLRIYDYGDKTLTMLDNNASAEL